MLFRHANQLGIKTLRHAMLTVVSVVKRSLRSALRSHARCHAIRSPMQTTVYKAEKPSVCLSVTSITRLGLPVSTHQVSNT